MALVLPATSRFRIVRRIGAGGMGIVFEAVDKSRGGRVALKTLPRADPDALYRFKAEFRALADLTHPNLVKLGELVGEGSLWYFTMEYVEGVTPLEYIRARP